MIEVKKQPAVAGQGAVLLSAVIWAVYVSDLGGQNMITKHCSSFPKHRHSGKADSFSWLWPTSILKTVYEVLNTCPLT